MADAGTVYLHVHVRIGTWGRGGFVSVVCFQTAQCASGHGGSSERMGSQGRSTFIGGQGPGTERDAGPESTCEDASTMPALGQRPVWV